MVQEQSYLQRLRFDPKLNNSLVAKYIFNPRLAILFVLMIILLGVYSFSNLKRTLNPEIDIPIVIVTTVLPGAGPQDVESLITIPIEDAVNNIEDVKTVQSTSRDSVSSVTLEFESGVNADKARTDVQSAVDSVSSLPQDAQAPRVIKLDFTSSPIWQFAVSSTSDTGSLMRYAKELRDRIESLPSVDVVSVTGLEEQEIQIIIRPSVISTYAINPQQIAQAITSSLTSFPAGNVATDTTSFSLSIDQAVTSIDDLRSLQINLAGTIVPLSDIADIYESPKPDQAPSLLASGKKAASSVVTFNVYKTESANIGAAYEDTHKLIDEERAIQSGQFVLSSIVNAAEEIDHQFSELQRDFLITTLLVFIVLFIFLGIKQAIIASLAIPTTFFISFIIMYLTGIELSFISLFSLLLALGLLVDDTIVVASAMTAYHRTGLFTPAQTGLLVWRDFLVAIFTTTITTVWAFIPLLLASGIIGEFIKPIPIVVSSTLLASFIVAMFITLPFVVILLNANLPSRVKTLLKITGVLLLMGVILAVLPKGNLYLFEILAVIVVIFITYTIRDTLITAIKTRFTFMTGMVRNKKTLSEYADNGIIHFSVISDQYHRIIESILRSPSKRKLTLIMAIIFSLFSYILLPLGFVKNEFFPKSDQDYVYMSLELPAGTTVQQANKKAQDITEKVRTFDDVSFVIAEVGQSMSQTGGTAGGSANNVLFTLSLKEDREQTSIELGEKLRSEFGTYADGKIAVTEATGGPPAGSDLQINLFGDDLTTLNTYADQIQQHLDNQAGVINVDKSIKPGSSKVVFTPNKEKVAESGITTNQLGFWMRLFASGFSPDSVTFSNDGNVEKDITIRMSKTSPSPEEIGSILIPTPQGNVTLSSLGTLSLTNNPTLITREDGKRTISISGGVTTGYSISTLNQALETYADSLNLPSGYSWKTGGVNEENQNSVNSILAAMLLSFLLIIITMVIQFSSFRRALIVMLVIPLSISGVFIIFALTNTPLSFPALIGVLALFGIVVKNSILVVDKIIQNEEAGLSFIPAIADAASSRLEAIALTSVATIFGLIPVTLSDPLWRGLGGAIIAGLTFSGTIMLFFIPVVYYYWFNKEHKSSK